MLQILLNEVGASQQKSIHGIIVQFQNTVYRTGAYTGLEHEPRRELHVQLYLRPRPVVESFNQLCNCACPMVAGSSPHLLCSSVGGVGVEQLHVWLVRVGVASVIGSVGGHQRGVAAGQCRSRSEAWKPTMLPSNGGASEDHLQIIRDVGSVVILLLLDFVLGREHWRRAVDEHFELLLLGLGLVR